MMKFGLLILLFFFLKSILVSGQVNPCHKSTEGKDFWFGFMESRHHQAGHKNEITLTSVYECNFKIFIGKSTAPYRSGILTANSPLQITIDWTLVEAIGSESIQEKAIHLVSDLPLNVYALNWSPNSADVALIFPSESLGNEYYAMCYTPHLSKVDPNSGNAEGKNSELMIVASEDNTVVSITPTVVTDHLKPANSSFSITINKGEIYQVQSANVVTQGQGDLTGSYIKSDKPVAVFSGSYSTTVPGDLSACCFDHLYEQLPPLQTWGRKFIAVPLQSREKDTYRVLAQDDNTTVRIGNSTLVPVLKKGEYREFMLEHTQPSLIESDKPVLLAQFSNSQSVDKQFTNGDGDPFMVVISPVNQTREKVAFVAYKSANIKDKYFINVVVKDDATGKINLDGVPVSFQALSGTGYSYAQVKITEGNHIIETTEPGKGFIAYVYGFGGVESYGYGVGFNLDIVLDLGSNIGAGGEKLLVRCDGAEPLSLNAGNGFDTYIWNTGETTSAIRVTNAGTYSVTVSTKDGCVLSDAIELEISKPVVSFGVDQTICNPEITVLDAGVTDQFINYLWTTPPNVQQPSLTDSKISVSTEGTYAVEVTNKYGCKANDEIFISFKDKPTLDLTELETLVCGTFSTALNVKADQDVTYSLESDPKLKFEGLTASVVPADFGAYPVTLTAKNKFSCIETVAFDLSFYKTPDVKFSRKADECAEYNLNVSYEGDADPAVSNFKWEFGGEVFANEIGKNSVIVPLGINRSERELSLTVTENGCSANYSQNFNVIPNLQLISDHQLGCEPYTALFDADNTEIVDYYWNFGDGSPIEKGDKNTTHLYQKTGIYDVMLKVTTIVQSGMGCSNEVKIEKMVHVAPIPDVAFSLSPDACLNLGPNEISYAGSIGTMNDTYDWELQQFDPLEIVKDPLQTQGPFIFDLKTQPRVTLGLKVTSEFNCASQVEHITLKRKPDFTVNSNQNKGCIPFDVLLSGVVSDPIDKVDFTWDFGDGSSPETGASVSHTYNEVSKSYNVRLMGTSSLTQCPNEVILPDFIRTDPKPLAAFLMDNQIVYNDKPTVNFTNSSIGAETYLWNFGDGTTSDQKDASHYFAVTGYRTVLLEAINEFQCSDTVSQKLLVAFDRIFPPNAFSPNAPNEIDREFKLISTGISQKGYHFTILSRWNDIVFEAREEIKGWNGQMPNGSPAPAGNYVWILNFSDFLGRPHRQTGTVTLVY